EDEVLHLRQRTGVIDSRLIGLGRLVRLQRRLRGPRPAAPPPAQGEAGAQVHASTPLIAPPAGAATRSGPPRVELVCVRGAMPSTLTTVARKSPTLTGRSSTVVPSALVLPMAWPPLMPPPARTVVQALGKWSRPCCGLIFGVRPNSPIQTMSVSSSRP